MIAYGERQSRDFPPTYQTLQSAIWYYEGMIADDAREANTSQGGILHRIKYGVKEHRNCGMMSFCRESLHGDPPLTEDDSICPGAIPHEDEHD